MVSIKMLNYWAAVKEEILVYMYRKPAEYNVDLMALEPQWKNYFWTEQEK